MMIHFDRVTKEYDEDTLALDDVTFGVKPGEFVSIVGHSGAGKTTLLRLVLAEIVPTSGNVFVDKVVLHELPRKELTKMRQRIGAVFQDFKLIPNLTVAENVAFAMEAAGQTDEEIAEDVPHVLELVDLTRKANNFPHELSGGEKQRVAIARAIVNQPDVLIADEPTGNLDPINTYDIVQILRRVNELGTTVILTTHNKGVIDSLGKRVITMEGGRIVRDDPHGRMAM
jgi:cell division transport system ATP-binding protein